ncbi:MAG: hypothetical protein LW865_02165 [Betaproteobacteria bacterium]|jgi:hypothetical protein|nr:hypothetical protein [Betaproteobacteria bacterium]
MANMIIVTSHSQTNVGANTVDTGALDPARAAMARLSDPPDAGTYDYNQLAADVTLVFESKSIGREKVDPLIAAARLCYPNLQSSVGLKIASLAKEAALSYADPAAAQQASMLKGIFLADLSDFPGAQFDPDLVVHFVDVIGRLVAKGRPLDEVSQDGAERRAFPPGHTKIWQALRLSKAEQAEANARALNYQR